MSTEPAEEPALTSFVTLGHAAALGVLAEGDLDLTGRIVEASNATLFGTCTLPTTSTSDGVTLEVVYKPIRGERPLWDFPDGTLAYREVASHLVSAAAGFMCVPPTVLRDGPFGAGMVQAWVDIDPETDYGTFVRSKAPGLRRMALFDVVVNNADRKGGHMLPVQDGRVFGCDHGLTFNTDDKLRTLLWQWRGKRLTDAETLLLAELAASLEGDLGEALCELLTTREVRRTKERVAELLTTARFPEPSDDWPAVPWPPF